MIRLILVVLAVVLYLIFSIPVLSYLKNLEKKDPKAAAKKSLDLVRWILGIVRDLAGITYEVRGLEHIPSDRAVLYVGNHRSYFDILAGYTTVPTLLGFVAKKEMEKIPLLRTWYSAVKPVDGADELPVFGPQQYKRRFKNDPYRD